MARAAQRRTPETAMDKLRRESVRRRLGVALAYSGEEGGDPAADRK
jgi:hypothetical protein